MENYLKLISLKRILPQAIKGMLQTVETKDYTERGEGIRHQASQNLVEGEDPKAGILDLNEDEEEKTEKKNFTFDDNPEN